MLKKQKKNSVSRVSGGGKKGFARKSTSKKASGRKLLFACLLLFFAILAISGCALIDPGEGANAGAGPIGQLLGSRSQALRITGILTILSLAPGILLMVTAFTRIVIVFSFVLIDTLPSLVFTICRSYSFFATLIISSFISLLFIYIGHPFQIMYN